MVKINDIFDFLCELAPLELQMDFDNSGFQIGHGTDEVSKVMLALDVTEEVVDEAIEHEAKLIITHHPLIFRGVKNICSDDPAGELLLRLLENRIAVISMHTNLDIAEGGVNDVLLSLLGGKPEGVLDNLGCGRIGTLDKPMLLCDFLNLCKEKLNCKGLRYYDAGKTVRKLAVMGGAGADSIDDAFSKGCDTYVTSDIKYHQFQRAAELNINLIDADHFCTENPVIYVLHNKLSTRFDETEFLISKKHKALISFA